MRNLILILLVSAAACASPSPGPKVPPPTGHDAAPVVTAPPDAAPAGTCSAGADQCCDPDGTVMQVFCVPVSRAGDPPLRTRGDGGWCGPCLLRCLPPGALIDTPRGAIAVSSLHAGDVVWTVDADGARVAAPILRVRSRSAPASHRVTRVTLDDGRVVTGSAGHPTADGRSLGDLAVGGLLDGAAVVTIEVAPLGGDATWDLLPAGTTGQYWADGVLLGSTLLGEP